MDPVSHIPAKDRAEFGCGGSAAPPFWNRWTALLLVALIWAGIYLPALGGIELRGEEGRRILPAISMIESGRWMVPQVGGEFYFKKPPLIQWLIAASFQLTGVRSDFSARLPSVLAVLAFALALVCLPLPWLSLEGRFLAALIFLTNIGMITKGRLIEIEATLISLMGLTSLVWLYLLARGASTWSLWGWSGLLMGAGLLLKGPIVLLFFYGLAIPVLLLTSRWRDLARPAAWAGLLLAVGLFGAWAWTAARQASSEQMVAAWMHELKGQALPASGLNLMKWGEKLLKGLGNFMPWLVLLPMLWSPATRAAIPARWWNLFRGCRWSLAACYLIIFFVPGSLPRYSMPLIPLASLLLGWVLVAQVLPGVLAAWRWLLCGIATLASLASVAAMVRWGASMTSVLVALAFATLALLLWIRRRRPTGWPRLAVATGILTVLGMLTFDQFGIPLIRQEESRRLTAELLNRTVPPGEKLYVFQAESLPMLFYVRMPFGFINNSAELTPEVHYLLVRKNDADAVRQDLSAKGQAFRNVRDISGRRVGSFELLDLRPAVPN